MKKVGELRQRAEGYRRLKRQITDERAAKALGDLADETEWTAAELEKRHLVRERAHEIWIEHGQPNGRDVEFWVAAERQIAVAWPRVTNDEADLIFCLFLQCCCRRNRFSRV